MYLCRQKVTLIAPQEIFLRESNSLRFELKLIISVIFILAPNIIQYMKIKSSEIPLNK